MTYQDFKNKYIGHGVDFDGFYGFQCMDLAEQYNKEVIGANRIGGNAKDAVNNFDCNKYTYRINTPNGVPEQGDVTIWGPMPGNPYGHISVFDHGDVNTFTSLDQNWPVNSVTHLQNHNYNYLLGWLHPKSIQPAGDDVLVSKIQAEVNGSDSPHDKITKIKQILA